MKNKGLIGLVIGALAFGTVSFFLYDKFKKKKAAGGSGSDSSASDITSIFTGGSSSSTSSTNSVAKGFPLGIGVVDSEQVAALQRFLNAEDGAGLTVDGDFGPLTEKAWLINQCCESFKDTSNSCWKAYLQQYPNAVIGKVDQAFYNAHIRKYEE